MGVLLAFSFAVLSRAVKAECVAPSAFPEPPDASYKPEHVQILLRHGARTPIVQFLPFSHRGIWQCDAEDVPASRIESAPNSRPRRIRRILDQRTAEFPPNCQVGDLTVEGMKMHEKLGSSFHSYIVDKLKLLPDSLDPERITARATWYERTYRSCVSFLKGLYSVDSMNEIMDIVVGTKDFDVVHPTKDMCSDLGALREEFFKSEEYQVIYKRTLITSHPLYEYTKSNNKTPEGLEKICDWAITYNCNEQNIGSLITDDIINQCNELQAYHFYRLNFFNSTKGALGAAPILREMFRLLDLSLNGASSAKLNIISAHDSVVAFILSAIGFGSDAIKGPPYASYVTLEVYSKEGELYVRFVFNGELVKIFGGETMIPLHNLRQLLMPKMYQCPELP